MVSASFALFLVAVAAVGYTNANESIDGCDDWVCLKKPENYHGFQDDIDALVTKNMAVISKTYIPPPNDMNVEITEGDEQNCEAITKVEKVYVIKDNGQPELVVQSQLLEQKIQVTRCKHAGAQCFGNVISPASFDKEATCEPKLGSVSLYVYDPKLKKIRYKMFDIPICCTCTLRNKN